MCFRNRQWSAGSFGNFNVSWSYYICSSLTWLIYCKWKITFALTYCMLCQKIYIYCINSFDRSFQHAIVMIVIVLAEIGCGIFLLINKDQLIAIIGGFMTQAFEKREENSWHIIEDNVIRSIFLHSTL